MPTTKTLDEVVVEAFKDYSFYEALVGNMATALANKDWELNTADSEELTFILSTDSIGLGRLLGCLMKSHSSIAEWDPPPWNPKV